MRTDSIGYSSFSAERARARWCAVKRLRIWLGLKRLGIWVGLKRLGIWFGLCFLLVESMIFIESNP
jgi:hypothetical protein